MFGNLSGPTLLVILFIVLLLFGAPKLPALAKSLGQSMKILKKEVTSNDDERKSESVAEEPEAPVAPAAQVVPPAPAARMPLRKNFPFPRPLCGWMAR